MEGWRLTIRSGLYLVTDYNKEGGLRGAVGEGDGLDLLGLWCPGTIPVKVHVSLLLCYTEDCGSCN